MFNSILTYIANYLYTFCVLKLNKLSIELSSYILSTLKMGLGSDQIKHPRETSLYAYHL